MVNYIIVLKNRMRGNRRNQGNSRELVSEELPRRRAENYPTEAGENCLDLALGVQQNANRGIKKEILPSSYLEANYQGSSIILQESETYSGFPMPDTQALSLALHTSQFPNHAYPYTSNRGILNRIQQNGSLFQSTWTESNPLINPSFYFYPNLYPFTGYQTAPVTFLSTPRIYPAPFQYSINPFHPLPNMMFQSLSINQFSTQAQDHSYDQTFLHNSSRFIVSYVPSLPIMFHPSAVYDSVSFYIQSAHPDHHYQEQNSTHLPLAITHQDVNNSLAHYPS